MEKSYTKEGQNSREKGLYKAGKMLGLYVFMEYLLYAIQ